VRRSADRHLAVSTWLRLLHGYALIERELRRAVAAHCTFPQFDVLSQLDRERDGLTFVELSRRLHPADRRAFRLTLTPKGRQLVRRAQGRHHRALAALLAGVPARDLRALRRLLDRLRASASSRATPRPR